MLTKFPLSEDIFLQAREKVNRGCTKRNLQANRLPLVRPNELCPLLTLGVVNGDGEDILVTLRSDPLLGLFVLVFVEVPGDGVLEVERYRGILQQRTVLGINVIFGDFGAALEIEGRAQPVLGPSFKNSFPDSRVVVQIHVHLDFRPLSGNALVELEAFLTPGAAS